MSARVIIVTSEVNATDADRGAVFATTLAAHLAEFDDVLMLDASDGSIAMSYLGVSMNKATKREANAQIWKVIRRNEEPDFFDGNDGDGPGDPVECVAVSTDSTQTGLANTNEDIVKLFRLAEETYEFIIVFMPQVSTSVLSRSMLGFGQDFFHVANPSQHQQYDSVAWLTRTDVAHSPQVTPVFYGVAAREHGWQKDFPNVVTMGMSWNDPALSALVDTLQERQANGPGTTVVKRSGSTVAKPALKRRWVLLPGRMVINGSLSFATVMGLTTFIPAIEGTVGDFSTTGVIVGAVVGGVLTSLRRERIHKQVIPADPKPEQKAVAGTGATQIASGTSAGMDYQNVWADIEARHKAVVDAWLEYELDVNLSLSYPTMLDHTVAATATLHKALGSAQMLASTKDATTNPLESPYGKAVQELELAYKVAEDYARKMGRSVWSEADRPKVETAEKLFAVALSDSASTNERQGAYKQALRNLEGVTAVPRKATERIEAAIAMIEAAPRQTEVKA